MTAQPALRFAHGDQLGLFALDWHRGAAGAWAVGLVRRGRSVSVSSLGWWPHRRVVLAEVVAMGSDRIPLVDALGVVLADIRSDAALTEQTSDKLCTSIARLVSACEILGAVHLGDITTDLLEEFIHGATAQRGQIRPAAPKTRANRHWAAKHFFTRCVAFGWLTTNPVASIPRPNHEPPPPRPLTDDEIERCRTMAARHLFDNRSPAVLALAEAGADTGEIAGVRVAEIDLQAGTVVLGNGAGRRTNPLTEWGVSVLEERLAQLAPDPDRLLVVEHSTRPSVATSSLSGDLRDILNAAGLRNDPTVQPRSIRTWAARRVLATQGIEAAARFLGCESLDTAARLLHHDWRRP